VSTTAESALVATWLPPEGYPLLQNDFDEWEVPLPDPNLSSIAIVVDTKTNELAGFGCLQSVVHSEPIKVREGYRNGEVLKLLVDKMQEPFKQAGSGFYAFAASDKIAHLLEAQGMVELPWRVFTKTFEEGDT